MKIGMCFILLMVIVSGGIHAMPVPSADTVLDTGPVLSGGYGDDSGKMAFITMGIIVSVALLLAI